MRFLSLILFACVALAGPSNCVNAAAFTIRPIANAPTFQAIGNQTNVIVPWWSNSIPPVFYLSIYYAGNTNTPVTTNGSANAVPGP